MLWIFVAGLLLINVALLSLHVGGALVQILPLVALVIAALNLVGNPGGKGTIVHDVLLKSRGKEIKWRV